MTLQKSKWTCINSLQINLTSYKLHHNWDVHLFPFGEQKIGSQSFHLFMVSMPRIWTQICLNPQSLSLTTTHCFSSGRLVIHDGVLGQCCWRPVVSLEWKIVFILPFITSHYRIKSFIAWPYSITKWSLPLYPYWNLLKEPRTFKN